MSDALLAPYGIALIKNITAEHSISNGLAQCIVSRGAVLISLNAQAEAPGASGGKSRCGPPHPKGIVGKVDT